MNGLLKYIKGDVVIWIVAILLALFSIVGVYSFIANLAMQFRGGNTFYFLSKHVMMILFGFGVMYIAHLLKYKYYSRLSQIGIWIAALLLLVTPFIGVNTHNAGRWIMIPVINQSFQPSDFAKIALIIYIARILSMKQSKIKSFKEGVLPILIPMGIICLLILPQNFSTAALLFVICLIMMFIGRVAIKHILLVVGSAVAAFGIMLMIASYSPDFLPRLNVWKNRIIGYEDTANSDLTYQADLAKVAIYNGGFFGKGPSNGDSKNILPQASSDFVYASFIEEYGSILGGLGLMLLYLIFLFRSIRIGMRCEKSFGSFLVLGLSLMIVFQAMINMAVSSNVIPVTGQPMPLVSMGGTSTLFTCLSIGIILSVSRSVYADKVEKTSNTKGEKEVAIA